MTFAESMDLCLRSSLPLFLFAMSAFALFIARPSSRQPKQVSTGYLHWGANATEPAINFAQNDLLLGSQDPFFWFLVPLLGLVSTGVCIVIHYAALALIQIFATIYGLFTAGPAWLSNDDKRWPPFYQCYLSDQLTDEIEGMHRPVLQQPY
jgi:glycosylphosphatidylinositol deacylase